MNKYFTYSILALVLTGCAASDPVEKPGDQGGSVDVVSSYLNLNVVSATKTRATFENGSPTENTVNRVRFFFFTADGNPAPVWENKGTGNNTFNSYQDWYPSATDATPGNAQQTVEKIYNVTLGLMLPGDLADNQPALVLAVLNPPAEVLALTDPESIDLGNTTITVNGPDLETLRTAVGDYRTRMTASGTFVMTNSVYVDDEGDIVDATAIDETNYGATVEAAEDNPVIIYVERVLARTDLILALNPETNPSVTVGDNTYYQVGSYKVFNGSDNATTENIYVDLIGWNVTGTPSKSRLIKLIDAGWTNSDLFGKSESTEPWNSDDYRRSYWAVNPMSNSFEYLFGDFNGTSSSTNFPATGNPFSTTSSVYLQENANTYNVGTNGAIEPEGPEYPTKIIIGARLVDAQGEPFLMAEWNYYKYTLPQMKIKIAQALSNLYVRTGTANSYTYTKISPDDFTFATAQQLGMSDILDPEYYVYPVLTTTAENYTWTLGEGENASVMSKDAVNTYILDTVHHVLVWGQGLTYYFFDIKHLGAEGSPAYYGVVRNHIYQNTLTSITGLGTPVYDPNQTIYPTQTENENNIVTADIQILQWRLVMQQYDLTWP